MTTTQIPELKLLNLSELFENQSTLTFLILREGYIVNSPHRQNVVRTFGM